jgi:hypothetical protein
MAQIVGAIGLPHTPMFPAEALRDPAAEFVGLFAECARRLDALQPDVLLVFTSDHFNSFFLDNWPTFACAVAPTTRGPNDETPMPEQALAMPEALGALIHHHLIDQGFDPALTQEIELDHSVMVPLHFLRPQADLPVMPVFINGHVPPLPRAPRVYAYGRAVGEAVRAWDADKRVVLIGSGSFSLEVGGPRIYPGKIMGVPDPGWAATVHQHFAAGQPEAVVEAATPARIAAAGNIAGELADWIAMFGALGPTGPADWIAAQPEWGHSFGVWRPA